VFVFNADWRNSNAIHTVTDYEVGVDHIGLEVLADLLPTMDAAAFSALFSSQVHQVGANVEIKDTASDAKIVLQNVNIASLSMSDFIWS